MNANEEWRHDPARRQAAADLHGDWMTAVSTATQKLQAAAVEFDGLPLPDGDSTARLVRRVQDAVLDALREAESFRCQPANETLVGNMAAFGIGTEEQ
jgi:hypothetical protein